tara:strand:- start:597 stop:758 length:162 start_codon:yes stop_codon:yes gene_type:complete
MFISVLFVVDGNNKSVFFNFETSDFERNEITKQLGHVDSISAINKETCGTKID